MRARSASSLRRQIAESARSGLRQRRFSAGVAAATPKTEAAMKRAATLFEPLEVQLRRYSIGSLAESLGGGFLSSMSRNLDSLLSSSLSTSLDEPVNSQSSGGHRIRSQQRGKAKQMNYQGVQEEEHDAHNIGKTGDQRSDPRIRSMNKCGGAIFHIMLRKGTSHFVTCLAVDTVPTVKPLADRGCKRYMAHATQDTTRRVW